MNSTIRDPAVAGTFYPERAAELRSVVTRCLAAAIRPREAARLLLAPHAGLIYSGAIAGAGYGCVEIPPLIVVLAPNHHGIGAPLALPRRGAWRTPLGELAIDEAATAAIAARGARASPRVDFRDDWRAHARDHALEVQLPFVQVACEARGVASPRLVTLSCGTHDVARLVAAGEAIAAGLADLGRTRPADVLLVVSSDMSHYIPADEARALDLPVLDLVRRCLPEALHAEVMGRGIGMCGIAPAVTGLAAARALGFGEGELLAYGSSGDVTREWGKVVAYASLRLKAA